MALALVEITPEVFLTCTTHAYTTEAEEVMGLLLGDIQRTPSGQLVSKIWMALPQIRTDRRKDRVESSYEQMTQCSSHAERFSKETGVKTRVVGWYHSHPHITVLPSHVDTRTQALYQMLDEGFVGLIFSVFNHDSNAKAELMQVTAFQSTAPSSADLPSVSSEDLADMDTNTKEAIRRSAQDALESRPHQWVAREVPLKVTPSMGAPEMNLGDYRRLQWVLLMEEKEAYQRAKQSAGPDPLARLHHAAVYQQGLCQLMEVCLAPALKVLTTRAQQDLTQIRQLEAENQRLQALLAQVQGSEVTHSATGTLLTLSEDDTLSGQWP